MSHRHPGRTFPLLALGLALTNLLMFGSRGHATPATALSEAAMLLAEARDLDLAPAAPTEPPANIRWGRDAKASQVFLDEKVLFRFQGDDGAMANRVAQRLAALRLQGALRSDRITPARQGGRFSVNVGGMVLIEIDEAFALKQGARAGALTLDYVNALRDRLGGVPIQVQASRGLLPGARSGVGMASWYGAIFHGRRAASGERFDMHAHTAAHKTLPFGTLLLVTNLANGKTTLVRITDRGPYAHGRTLDLSRAAADALGMIQSGVARVRYTILH